MAKVKIHAKHTRVIRHEGDTFILSAGKTHEVDESLLAHPFVKAYIDEGSLSTSDRAAAKEEAATVKADASKEASAIVSAAKEEAAQIIEAAKKEAEQITTEALNKAAEIESASHGKGKKGKE